MKAWALALALALPPLPLFAQGEPLKLGDTELVDLAGGTSAPVVVFYSGDGGWVWLDKAVGEAVSAAGFRVLGVSSLAYFWQEKPPEDAARDLDVLVAGLADGQGGPRIALVGYSFGADALPAIINRLQPETRRRIALVSLIAFARTANFAVSVAGMLGGEGDDATAPEIARLRDLRLQCIYGQDEAAESGCTDPAMPETARLALPGGHHFNKDYDAVAARLIDALRAVGG